MNSTICKIKIKSTVLAFCLQIIQFILYNHLSDWCGDCCKTICLSSVKSIEELGSLKEKENIHHLVNFTIQLKITWQNLLLKLERKKTGICLKRPSNYFLNNLRRIYVVAPLLVFWGTSTLFSKVAVPVYIPTSSAGSSLVTSASPAFIVCRCSGDCHSDWCEAEAHCCFDLHFSHN